MTEMRCPMTSSLCVCVCVSIAVVVRQRPCESPCEWKRNVVLFKQRQGNVYPTAGVPRVTIPRNAIPRNDPRLPLFVLRYLQIVPPFGSMAIHPKRVARVVVPSKDPVGDPSRLPPDLLQSEALCHLLTSDRD